MSPTTWGWLVLLFPLLGTIIIGLGFRTYSRAAGLIGTAAIFLAFVYSPLEVLGPAVSKASLGGKEPPTYSRRAMRSQASWTCTRMARFPYSSSTSPCVGCRSSALKNPSFPVRDCT